MATAQNPELTTSTRQRLLELWEKCPECNPGPRAMKLDTAHCWWVGQLTVTEWMAFALARDAMVRWLLTRSPDDSLNMCWSGGDFWIEYAGGNVYVEGFEDLTDALISAVEAVMEKNS